MRILFELTLLIIIVLSAYKLFAYLFNNKK